MFSDMHSDPIPVSVAATRLESAPDFVVVDVETSCSNVSSICQIGIVGFRNGIEIFDYETLVDPLDRFSSFNTRIHGITGDHVMGAPTFADIHAAIDGHLSGRITVAHSFFDKGALGSACRIHARSVIETTWLDSVRVAKRAWPELPSHRLNVLTKFLGIRHKHHDALSDARAAGMVVVRAMEHTGIELAGWLAPSNARSGPAPKPAAAGPLKGERVAILGAPRDGMLAQCLASEGARIVASVGTTTTMLVVSSDQPFGRFFTAHADHRKAEAMRRAGTAIQIVREDEIRHRLALPVAPTSEFDRTPFWRADSKPLEMPMHQNE
jgi:DNA polymerase-3 subunit epsilon